MHLPLKQMRPGDKEKIMKYYDILKSKRKERKISLRKMGEMIGKTHTVVAEVEQGKLKKKETVEAMMDALEFTYDERVEVLQGMAEEHYLKGMEKYVGPKGDMDATAVPEDLRKKLGDFLKKRQEHMGLGCNELCKLSGVNPSILNKIYQGTNKRINPYQLQRLGDALKIDYRFLYQMLGYIREVDYSSDVKVEVHTTLSDFSSEEIIGYIKGQPELLEEVCKDKEIRRQVLKSIAETL